MCRYLGTPGGGALLGREGMEGGPGSGDTAGRDGGPGAARPPGRRGPGGARRWGVGLDMGDLQRPAERLREADHTHCVWVTADPLLGYLRPDGIPVTCSQESSTGGGIVVVMVEVLMSPMMFRPSRRA